MNLYIITAIVVWTMAVFVLAMAVFVGYLAADMRRYRIGKWFWQEIIDRF